MQRLSVSVEVVAAQVVQGVVAARLLHRREPGCLGELLHRQPDAAAAARGVQLDGDGEQVAPQLRLIFGGELVGLRGWVRGDTTWAGAFARGVGLLRRRAWLLQLLESLGRMCGHGGLLCADVAQYMLASRRQLGATTLGGSFGLGRLSGPSVPHCLT